MRESIHGFVEMVIATCLCNSAVQICEYPVRRITILSVHYPVFMLCFPRCCVSLKTCQTASHWHAVNQYLVIHFCQWLPETIILANPALMAT